MNFKLDKLKGDPTKLNHSDLNKKKDMSFLCCDWCPNIISSEKNKKQKKPYKPSLGEDLDEE